ncbi:hypothetical protein EJB05_41826, partial [Eragrostis curvula]
MGCEGAERCELCGAPAAVHCAADAAFLCASCDAKVHGANFLASRHRRTRLTTASAADVEEEEDGYESASSSSCVSTADSAASTAAPRARPGPGPSPSLGRRRPRPRGEAVLEGWAKRAGLFAPGAARRRAAAAARALRACGPDVAAARVPLRVAMAAALWREVAAGGLSQQGDALRRLEAYAHVPARLLLAVASSMARCRATRRAAADAAEEGWDECSWAGPKSDPPRS